MSSIHARCRAVDQIDGRTVICGKSAGHDRPGADDQHREHYDPGAEVRWPAPPIRRRRDA
ncbi:hypothetical protein RVR_8361 [Actinacidiphila reveromycinica]|uniref:Uncharacterized protein n=1 Tax=Actinacidiphila reveromycinica TaxID=659352 RepID=A0A7U3VRS3_9ACTN|nr:hypothetical protein [Streptomyces sp. SN-593]BBB01106.1 hypothetical protein RVR_8361 [Streptomyces sp. SN-593]